MTSQLNVDTIVDKAGSGGTNVKIGNTSTYVADGGSGTTQNAVQGLAKAFCRASNSASLTNTFNIASGTDNGTGNYTYTFTNNMQTNGSSGTAVGISNGARTAGYSNVQTSQYDTDYHNEDGTDTDVGNATNTFGDLA